MARLDLSKIFSKSVLPPDRSGFGRIVLLVFFTTYLLTRIVIAFDMLHDGPKIYLHDGGTHVHHFVYGICLLSLVSGYLLFGNPGPAGKRMAAFCYGLGLALAFDEFGMWLKLKDLYWQRISYEAVSVLTGILAFIAFLPKKATGQRSCLQIGALCGACILLSLSLISIFGLLRDRYGLKLRETEIELQETTEAPKPSPNERSLTNRPKTP